MTFVPQGIAFYFMEQVEWYFDILVLTMFGILEVAITSFRG